MPFGLPLLRSLSAFCVRAQLYVVAIVRARWLVRGLWKHAKYACLPAAAAVLAAACARPLR
jgi:hypothetical protein